MMREGKRNVVSARNVRVDAYMYHIYHEKGAGGSCPRQNLTLRCF